MCPNRQHTPARHKNAPLRGGSSGALWKPAEPKGGNAPPVIVRTARVEVGSALFYENALPIRGSTGHCELSPPFPPKGQDASSIYRKPFRVRSVPTLIDGPC